MRQSTQKDEFVAPPLGLLVPAGQREQVSSEVADVESLYFPERQEVHVEDAGEEENLPSGQLTHADKEIDPSLGLLVPAGQSEQVIVNVASLNLPELQREQLVDAREEVCFPSRQPGHTAVPWLGLLVPAGHSEQVSSDVAEV